MRKQIGVCVAVVTLYGLSMTAVGCRSCSGPRPGTGGGAAAAPSVAPTPTAASAPRAEPTKGSEPAAGAEAAGKPIIKLSIWADADPDLGDAPLTVQLTVDPLEDIKSPSYTWDFGDGSPGTTEVNPKHTYSRPGQYKARVKVRDADGNIGEDEAVIDVDAPVTPEPEETPTPTSPSAPEKT